MLLSYRMASALTYVNTATTIQTLSSSHSERFTVNPWPSRMVVPRHSLVSSTLVSARRRNQNSAVTSTSSSKRKKKNVAPKEGDVDENEFEALFNLMEEDFKDDELSLGGSDDDELSEEDIDKLQRELEAALGVGSDDDEDYEEEDELEDGDVMLNSFGDDEDGELEVDEEEDEEEERPVKLKTWQLRRLASALKKGRRKTSIKSLAGELCLERAVVLEYLRNPPPNLVLMSAALPDEPEPVPVAEETKPKVEETTDAEAEETTDVPEETTYTEAVKSDSKVKVPVHVMRHEWYAQKRLKKVQVETLERVYKRTRRPTNSMISSIVHVTNIPRKRVVKWFEDKRTEDEVPGQRNPYRRSVPETVSAS